MNEIIGCRDGSANGYRKKLFLNLVVLLLAALCKFKKMMIGVGGVFGNVCLAIDIKRFIVSVLKKTLVL